MARKHLLRPLKLFSVALSLELLMATSLPTQVKAQVESLLPGQTTRVTFDPQGNRKPKDTAGGASRSGGLCPGDVTPSSTPVTPFKPATTYGLTVVEHPMFFVHLPQTVAREALFILKDEQEDYFYQKSVSLPTTPGLLRFKLPAEAPALEKGKQYQWSFIILCEQNLRPDSPTIMGQIQRVEPDPVLISQVMELSPLERAAFYGKDGI
ncbi:MULTISPECIES: DUF928 domain-containing protein [unclassified Coleofasciculus]|uniref:DUF928 domain-containing protein n=1 Tax=unclassified Coleofasciculus TaxID=2692782 RepID=UPI001880F238|nr:MULTISPECIES: DUF928 domain-containing protein [unclassified Coleofasciculus]MBE9126397.1 DUF928 domain-containing protein [Coleofasciculus sp. LEGE 07081]MBE9149824.1 DUF928 domain-containing protein [Coleofasciculus sp. LEGE 07092]